MPINILQKNSPRGKGPPASDLADQVSKSSTSQEENLKEADLAAQEKEALWESQEVGITRWSGEGDSRYSDSI